MAEPFSTASAAVSVADVIYRVGSKIKKNYNDSKTIDKDIEALLRDIDNLESIRSAIKKVHQAYGTKASGPVIDHIDQLWSNIGSILDKCKESLIRLENYANVIVGRRKDGDRSKIESKLDAYQKVRRKDEIMPDFNRERQAMIELQGNLQTLLTFLNVAYTNDSQKTTGIKLDHLSKSIQDLPKLMASTILSQISSLQQAGHLVHDNQFNDAIHSVTTTCANASINRHFYVPQTVNSVYTGRVKKLKELQGFFDETCSEQKRFIIYGTAGSGKTQFCSKFAQDNQELFWGIFYVDASQPRNAECTFSRIAKIAGIEPTEGSNTRAARDWLSRQEGRWLLIIDNADDAREDVQSYFPDGKRGCVLVTTQNPSYGFHGTVGTKFFRFGALPAAEALDLLLKAAGLVSPWDAKTRQDAEPISKRLGYLPLALLQAGSAVRNKLCTLVTYIEHLQRSWDRLRLHRVGLHKHKEDEESKLYVYTSYEMNLEQLEKSNSQTDNDALELLQLFSCFHFDNIRVDFLIQAALVPRIEQQHDEEDRIESKRFEAVTKRKTNGQHLKDEALEWLIFLLKDRGPTPLPRLLRDPGTQSPKQFEDQVKHRLHKALHQLSLLSLIMHNESKHIDSYSMHSLWHRWIRERPSMKLSQQAVWCQAARTTLARAVLLPPHASSEPERALRRELLPHVQHVHQCQDDVNKRMQENEMERRMHLLGSCKSKITQLLTTRTLSQKRKDMMELAKFSRVFIECGKLDEAEKLQLEVKKFVGATVGFNGIRATPILRFLAFTYRLQTRANDAADIEVQVLKIYQECLGPHHPKTHKMLDTLGATRCAQGRYQESIDLHNESLRGMEGSFTGQAADILCQLEDASQKIQRFDQISWNQTVRRHQDAVKSLKGASITDPADLFSAWGNKGKILWRYFRYDEARQYFKKAALGQRALMDISDLRTQDALQDLASTYLDFEGEPLGGDPGLLDDAYDMLQKIREVREKNMGEEAPLTLWVTAIIARIESCRGNHHQAEEIYLRIIPIVSRTFGREHFATLSAKVYYTQALIRHERFGDAETEVADILEKSRWKRSARSDGNHPDHIIALWCVIQCHEGHRKFSDALERVVELEGVLATIGGEGRGKMHPFAKILARKKERLERLSQQE